MAIASRDDAPKWENSTRVNMVSGMTGAFTKTYDDMALTHDAFIPCTATYDAAAKRHTLTPVQAGLALPDVFTVRFIATAGFKAGDKVYLAGAEYMPAYTDSDSAVAAGVWMPGAVVELSCSTQDKKAFVGKAFANKANENILRNSNFAINQRGQTTYNAGSYTVDGFRLSAGTVTVLSNGVRLSADAVDFYQAFLTSEDKRIHDGVYTISAKIAGEIVSRAMVLNFSALNTYVGGVLGTSGVYVNVICNWGVMGKFIIGLQAKGTSRVVEWVKLEEGGTTTRYVLPNPADELERCQRFYLDWYGAVYLCKGNTGSALGTVQFPTTMRIIPTIAIKSGENSDKIHSSASRYGLHLYNHTDALTLMVSNFTADAEIY